MDATLHKIEYYFKAGAIALFSAALAWSPIATLLARKIPRPDPSAPWWKRLAYDIFIDTPAWTAAIGRSGIFGGTFNFPLVPSRDPSDNPTPAASKFMRMRQDEGSSSVPPKWKGDNDSPLLVLVLAIGLAGMLVVGAGCTGANALGRCELNTLPQQLEGLLARVVAAAFTSGTDWNAQLEQAAAGAAPGQGACVMQAVLGWLEDLFGGKRGEPAEPYMQAQKRLRGYLDAHPAVSCGGKLPRAAVAAIVSDQVLLRLGPPAPPRTLWVDKPKEQARFGGGGATGDFEPATVTDRDLLFRVRQSTREVMSFRSNGSIYVYGLRVL
jgi:hypothetical protein